MPRRLRSKTYRTKLLRYSPPVRTFFSRLFHAITRTPTPVILYFSPEDTAQILDVTGGLENVQSFVVNNKDIKNALSVQWVRIGLRKYQVLMINSAGVALADLHPFVEYDFRIAFYTEIPLSYMYVVYRQYHAGDRNKDTREFQICFFTDKFVEFDRVMKHADEIFTAEMGEDFSDTMLTLTRTRYVGRETLSDLALSEIDFKSTPTIGEPYIIIDLMEHYNPYYWTNITKRGFSNLIRYRQYRLTVDIDKKDQSLVTKSIDTIVSAIKNEISRYDVWESKKGYHIVFQLKERMDFDTSLKLREAGGDDEDRIIMDNIRYEIDPKLEGVTGVLFDTKMAFYADGHYELSHTQYLFGRALT